MEPSPRPIEFKVYDIASEAWLIAHVTCACGGDWARTGPQRLVEVGGRPCDEMDVACRACGRASLVRFDVSAFFAYKQAVEDWVAITLPDADERTQAKVARRIGAPFMTRFTSFVRGLATDGDRHTLRYMQSRIQQALDAPESTPPS